MGYLKMHENYTEITILWKIFWYSNDLLMINISSPTSRCRKRNCLFKFDKSIVSISITSISPKPNKAKFFNISQPSPPAPMTRIRHCSCKTESNLLNSCFQGYEAAHWKPTIGFKVFD